jgi:hypothetical protein
MLLLASPPVGNMPVGVFAAAAQRLFRGGGAGGNSSSCTDLVAHHPRPVVVVVAVAAPPPATTTHRSSLLAPSSLFPRALHRWVPPSPPALFTSAGFSGPPALLATRAVAAVATSGSGSDSDNGGDSSSSSSSPFLPRSTLVAATAAFCFAAGASVLAETWREARILRPPRPAPPPAAVPGGQQQTAAAAGTAAGTEAEAPPLSYRDWMVRRLEAAVDEFSAEERALAARLRAVAAGPRRSGEGAGGVEGQDAAAAAALLRERLQEARVLRAALAQQLDEQRALRRREDREEQRARRRRAKA